jgi:hypothetical protein
MSYKALIQRKIAFMMEQKQNALKKTRGNRFAFFSDNTRKEVIVWMWLQKGKDKDQVKEFIIDKFNLSEQDAENLFYEAYPDGLDLQEEEILNNLDSMLTEVVGVQPKIVSDTMQILNKQLPESALEQYQLPSNVQNQIKIVIGTLLQSRQLI